MKLGTERHHGLEVGTRVEVLRGGFVIWEGEVTQIGPKDVTVRTHGMNPQNISLVLDEDDGRWKQTFVDMDRTHRINKKSPGFMIRPVADRI